MTLLSSLQSVRMASVENPAAPLTGTLTELFGGETVASGRQVTEHSALSMSGVWRAVTLISGVSAALPFHPYRRGADGERIPAVGNAAKLMDEPHPDMTPVELWGVVHAHRLMWGNAYLRILRERFSDRPVELWPIEPWRVKVGRTSETGQKVYTVALANGTSEVHVEDPKRPTILHLPAFGYDGICGVSPIRAAKQSIGLGLAAEEFGGRLFGSGALATGILQTEQRLTQGQADALALRWKQKQSGLDSAHSTVILDRGAKFQQLTIPPEDAQFLESRRFQITEMCRWFGLPPFLMHETEKSTSWGTGLEQQALGWVVFDLNRFLVPVEQRMTRLLRPQAVYAHYTLEGLLRGDSSARASFYNSMWNLGALSTNEIRELEERPPVEGGDVHYRPLHMGQLGTAESTTDPVPAPEGVPANA